MTETVFGKPGDSLFEMAKAYAHDERDQYPESSRTNGEQYYGRAPIYWTSRDGQSVRVAIVDLRYNEVSRAVVIPISDYLARPKSDPLTKPEAEWAFKLCGFSV